MDLGEAGQAARLFVMNSWCSVYLTLTAYIVMLQIDIY